MSWLKGLLGNVLRGEGLVKELGDVADRFIQTKDEKEAFKLEAVKIAHRQELEMQRAEIEADKEFNSRIKQLEGTAKDLLQAGWMGKVVLFFRGAQRPAWGWGVLIFDWLYFTNRIEMGGDGEKLLYVINLLVLGFLFGERALKNVAPLVKDIIQKKADS